ncbi:MAG: DUF937 domain-containing protein [Ginsengibacter sp.]
MTHTIPDDIKNYFTVEFISVLSNNLDEPNPGIAKAVSAIIPTSLAAIVQKSEKDSTKMYALTKDAALYYPRVPDVAKLQNNEVGSNLPHDIFGSNEHEVARHIAAYSGLRPTSVSSLIMLILPVMMGKIGEGVQRDNLVLGENGIFLSGYEEDIQRLTPAGYIIPDLTHPVIPIKEDEVKIHEANINRDKTNFVFPKWVPILIVAIVILLLIYFSRM